MPDPLSPQPPLHPPIPPVSARDEPRFASAERKSALADAFQGQGDDYDRLRPGYPDAVLEAVLAQVPTRTGDGTARAGGVSPVGDGSRRTAGGAARAVDLGAGTGKLSWALADRGLEVTAVDPSAAMLETARRRGAATIRDPDPDPDPDPGPSAVVGAPRLSTVASPELPSAGTLATHVATAESTGLAAASAELITVAQAWHWFDAEAASAEVVRVLADGGVLALVWNMLDVTIPWVHRLSRIMHAGDIHREDFLPTVGPELRLLERGVHQWEDPMATHDVIDLARTRSYVITAPEERRAKVLANLDWYLHEHLGHAPGSTVGVPYRTDWFLYRAVEEE